MTVPGAHIVNGSSEKPMAAAADAAALTEKQHAPSVSPTASKWQVAFVAFTLVCLVLPFACMSFARTDTTTENHELAAWPDFFVDGSLNTEFLPQMGTYFEDHYAFRNQLVTADAKLRSTLFGVSNTDMVVVGTDGWLYYSGTLDDYLGRNTLSDRSLENIAYNLSLAQKFVESRNAAFVFTIAPDKSALYPSHMPLFYHQTSQASNAERLKPYLQEYGVNYVDLFSAFKAQTNELYFKRDTHWNNEGALLAYNAILDGANRQHDTYAANAKTVRNDYIGDLNAILYPSAAQPEENTYIDALPGFQYAGDATNVEDSWVKTASAGTGTLLMYRDSFANSLIPLMAPQFAQSYFSKLVPYDMANVDSVKPDVVVYERAERNLSYLGETPPVIQGPTVNVKPKEVTSTETTLTTWQNGSYLMVEGVLDASCTALKDRVLITIAAADGSNAKTYQAYRTTTTAQDGSTSDCGYMLYLSDSSLPASNMKMTVSILRGEGLESIKEAYVASE